jgi:Ca2+-binding EF-hand superfamily protein
MLATSHVAGKTLGSKFEEYITYLFKKMDTNQDKVVDWDEFCTYMIVGLKERDELDNERENPIMMYVAISRKLFL